MKDVTERNGQSDGFLTGSMYERIYGCKNLEEVKYISFLHIRGFFVPKIYTY